MSVFVWGKLAANGNQMATRKMTLLTTRALAGLAKTPGKWKSERLAHGHGALAFRSLPGGSISIYFRYIDAGRRVALSVGQYDETGRAGLTLAQSRARAGELSKLHAGGVVAIREHVEAEARAANAVLRKQDDVSFSALLAGYLAGLESEGRASWKDVRNQLLRWVIDAHPSLMQRRAADITRADIMGILTVPAGQGLTRTVNQLRSYLLAAFNRAIGAGGDASIAAHSSCNFGVESNPAALTRRVQRFDVARERVLSVEEFRSFLFALDALPFITSAALRLCVMLGGQRPQQLIRVAPGDVDLVAGLVRLADGKGRRSQPRAHVLPLPAAAADIFKKLIDINGASRYLFTNDGKKQVVVDTVSHRVNEISGGSYQLRDIRRSIETEMARLGISRDIRAQIQSHGLSGVQERHYDKYNYMAEKRAALNLWADYLDELRNKPVL